MSTILPKQDIGAAGPHERPESTEGGDNATGGAGAEGGSFVPDGGEGSDAARHARRPRRRRKEPHRQRGQTQGRGSLSHHQNRKGWFVSRRGWVKDRLSFVCIAGMNLQGYGIMRVILR